MNINDIITAAMADAHTLHFDYDNKPRIVEAHALGQSTKDGTVVLRGFQVAGERAGWALYTVHKIHNLSVSAIPMSEAPRPGYKLDDKQMSTIIAQVPA